MKVRAIKLGYYDHKRRREGAVFNLFDKKDFSKSWMESLEEVEAPAKAKGKVSKPAAKPAVEVDAGSSDEVI